MTSLEIPPTLRMLAAIFDHIEAFFAESDCPLTNEQQRAMGAARADLSSRERQVAA